MRDDPKNIYERLLASYRDLPGQHRIAAREAKTDLATAELAWHQGLTGLRAIKDVIEEEQLEARAKRLRDEAAIESAARDDQLKAKQDAINARSKEAQGARLSRENALVLGIVSSRLLNSAAAISQEIQRRVAAGLTTMSLDDLRKLLHTATYISERSQYIFRQALEIERIIQGEPIETYALRVDKMTPEQIEQEFMKILRSAERAAKVKGHASTLSPITKGTPEKN